MLHITPAHMSHIHEGVAETYVTELLEHARATQAAAVIHADDAAVKKALRTALHKATAIGWRARGPTRLYAELALLRGSGFAADPFQSWFATARQTHAHENEETQAAACHAALVSYWQLQDGADGKRHKRALERLLRLDPFKAFVHSVPVAARVADALQALYPAFWNTAPDTARQWLCLAAAERVSDGMSHPASGMLACLQFYLGHAILRDPLHPWLRDVLTATPDDANQAEVLRDAMHGYLAGRLAATRADSPANDPRSGEGGNP